MINPEIKKAVNDLLNLLEKHNTPGFILIPEPQNPLYAEVTFKNSQLHDEIREMLTTTAMTNEYKRIARIEDPQKVINNLTKFKDKDINFERNVRNTFTDNGCTDEYTSSILLKVLNPDPKIDRSLGERRFMKKNK